MDTDPCWLPSEEEVRVSARTSQRCFWTDLEAQEGGRQRHGALGHTVWRKQPPPPLPPPTGPWWWALPAHGPGSLRCGVRGGGCPLRGAKEEPLGVRGRACALVARQANKEPGCPFRLEFPVNSKTTFQCKSVPDTARLSETQMSVAVSGFLWQARKRGWVPTLTPGFGGISVVEKTLRLACPLPALWPWP